MSVATLNTLLEKATDPDKDARFMATNDLCAELQKDIKMDVNMERRICQTVLKQLDDQSNDVQSIAVKCLGILFKRVQEAQVSEICDKLCGLVLEGKPELRDIYSIGLKTLIADVPEEVGPAVASCLAGRLLGGIQQRAGDGGSGEKGALEVKLECLDNLTDLLKRFGREVEGQHERVLLAGLQELRRPKPVVRKRANACLGALAVVASDALLNRLMEELLGQIAGGGGKRDVQTLIQTVGTVSRTVGHRLGRHLGQVVPLLIRFLGSAEEGEGEGENDDERNELRETIFASLESVVLRCPREVSTHLPGIVDAALGFMKYDPNYTYEEEEGDGGDAMAADNGDEDGEGEEGEEEYGEEDEEEDYGDSDDDDTSWKVRRAALRVLSAVISSRPELLQQLYAEAADPLIGRFKEREENVRLDVVACFTSLLKATLAQEGAGTAGRNRTGTAGGGLAVGRGESAGVATMAVDGEGQGEGESVARTLLAPRLEAVVRAADKQLKVGVGKKAARDGHAPNAKTKSAVLGMLRSLAYAVRGGLGGVLPTVMADVRGCLQDKGQQGLKLDALALLHTLLETHPPQAVAPFVPAALPLVTACAEDEWYKLIAQALRVLGVMVAVVRPLNADRSGFDGDYDAAALVPPLYAALLPRLEAHDIDQEIKECAITAVGKLLTHLGDRLSSEQLGAVLALLMEKLRNEITRTPALRALADVATSPLQIDLSPILAAAVSELSLFLRQQSRPLKLATLSTLIALVRSNAGSMTPDLFELVLTEAAALISDSDLHLSHLALLLTLHALKASPASSAPIVAQHSLPRVLKLAASPLLQGYALRSLLSLLDELVTLPPAPTAPGLGFTTLVKALESIALAQATGGSNATAAAASSSSAVSGAAPKQVVHNLAVCMARASASAPSPKERDAFTKRLVENMRAPHDATRHLALLCIGELGAQMDLSASVPGLQGLILESFRDGGDGGDAHRLNEETKTAAAYALGHVTAGNPGAFLPLILGLLAKEEGAMAAAAATPAATPAPTKGKKGGKGSKASASSAAAAAAASSTGAGEVPEYLLLLALKEVVLTHKAKGLDFSAYVGEVLPHLLAHAQAPEEGVRNMVAECLGTLANIDPPAVFAALQGQVAAEGADQHTRWTVATALKYSMSCSSPTATSGPTASGSSSRGKAAAYLLEHKELLQITLEHALAVQVDATTGSTEDLEAVRATLLMVNAAAHHQPRVILPFLQSHAVPLLFKAMELKLLRKVNLGPFTHTVDDGLPLRKAAFACLDTLLDALPQVLELSSFMPYLAKGLEDKDDVQLLAHQILAKACRSSPQAVLGALDQLLPPLEAVANKQIKESQVVTEVERAQDLVRSALRALVAIAKVEGAVQHAKLTQAVERIQAKENLRSTWQQLLAERRTGE